VFELSSAFAPSLKIFLLTRALFGIAMGGEWGVGAALAFETPPAEDADSSRDCCRKAAQSAI
jgi:SHS family lactate transporter-like MFS transporter